VAICTSDGERLAARPDLGGRQHPNHPVMEAHAQLRVSTVVTGKELGPVSARRSRRRRHLGELDEAVGEDLAVEPTGPARITLAVDAVTRRTLAPDPFAGAVLGGDAEDAGLRPTDGRGVRTIAAEANDPGMVRITLAADGWLVRRERSANDRHVLLARTIEASAIDGLRREPEAARGIRHRRALGGDVVQAEEYWVRRGRMRRADATDGGGSSGAHAANRAGQ